MSIIPNQRLDIAQNAILGRKTTGTGNWEVLTAADVATILFPSLKRPPGTIIYQAQFASPAPVAAAQTANTLRATAWDFLYPTTVNQISASVNTALAGSSARVAIYDSTSTGTPGTKLAATELLVNGALATTQNLSFTDTLLYGRYWVVWNVSAALTLRGLASAGLPSLGVNASLGNNSHNTAYSAATAFGVLPATFPVGATLTANTAGLLAALRVV